MQILVFEFVTGGGLAGRFAPRSLAREGLAMRSALVEDLAAIGRHQILVTADARFIRPSPRGVEMISVDASVDGLDASPAIDALVDASDAVWLIAPETNRCLERLAAGVERRGKLLLGSGASAVRVAADKSRLHRRLARVGIGHPKTTVLTAEMDPRIAARRIGYPVVVKPARGAGCAGVRLARRESELPVALQEAHRANGGGPLVMQQYVRGRAASVSLLTGDGRAVAIAVNAQRVIAGTAFAYRGGTTPYEHPLARAAAEVAERTCAAIPGLRGYVGVDVVLTDAGPVVIEVNARLTLAYLGIRAVVKENVAALAIAACNGCLRIPKLQRPWRRARFTSSGRVMLS